MWFSMAAAFWTLSSCGSEEPGALPASSGTIAAAPGGSTGPGSDSGAVSTGWQPTAYCEAICDYMYACRSEEIEEFSYYDDYEHCTSLGFCEEPGSWEEGQAYAECIDCFTDLAETCDEDGNSVCASMQDCLHYVGE